MLMDESRRAAVLKKCDIFSRTVDLFEKLVKSRLTEKEAENLQGMVGQISSMRDEVGAAADAAATDASSGVDKDCQGETDGKHLLEFDEIMKGDFTLENMLNDLKEL